MSPRKTIIHNIKVSYSRILIKIWTMQWCKIRVRRAIGNKDINPNHTSVKQFISLNTQDKVHGVVSRTITILFTGTILSCNEEQRNSVLKELLK